MNFLNEEEIKDKYNKTASQLQLPLEEHWVEGCYWEKGAFLKDEKQKCWPRIG